MSKQEDLYEVLRLSKGCSHEEIKKAYKKMAVEFHPDKTAGDKEKEELFKKVSEAYSVLSDPQKKEMYDRYGVVDGGGGAPPPDLSDMLKNMFGGGGGPMPGGGFSFMFGGGPGPDIFENFFGGGGGGFHHQGNPGEVVDVSVTLSELFHGTSKKVEFELIDLCQKCQGSGAQDPSCVLKCMTCKGEGRITMQINPLMMTTVMCDSCGGNGSVVKNGRYCSSCKGRKTQFTKRGFEVAIPKGIPNGHIVRMPSKGSWNEATKQYNTITFRIVHDIKQPFAVRGHDVVYTMDITLEDLLCGFEKEIDLYGEKTKIASQGYFNPLKPHVTPGRGLSSKKGAGNFVLEWRVVFEDSHRLAKYNDVFQKVLKRRSIETGDNDKYVIIVGSTPH